MNDVTERDDNIPSEIVLLNASLAESLVIFRGPIIAEMIARRHRVHVSAPEISGSVRGHLEAMGAVVHEVPLARTGTNPVADLAYYRALRELIGRVRPSRVLGYTIKPNIWGSLAARNCGVRSASMVTGLGYAFIKGTGLKRRLMQKLQRLLYARATRCNDRVIFQNPDDRDDFIKAKCLADPSKAIVVDGSGVDVAYFSPMPLPERPIFLMIARLLVTKGVREYAEAATLLARENPGWEFRLAGYLDPGPDGIEPAELESWCADGLTYLGKLDDVRPALAEASIYVLPSYREGTPRTVLEAMALGRPIVTTDVPGCRETVRQDVNGLLVAARSASALSDAMVAIGQDGAMRARMGSASRQIAEERYTVDRVNAAVLKSLGL
jgi:glycosyltransferase involved in cell wall biosynthesis